MFGPYNLFQEGFYEFHRRRRNSAGNVPRRNFMVSNIISPGLLPIKSRIAVCFKCIYILPTGLLCIFLYLGGCRPQNFKAPNIFCFRLQSTNICNIFNLTQWGLLDNWFLNNCKKKKTENPIFANIFFWSEISAGQNKDEIMKSFPFFRMASHTSMHILRDLGSA